MGVLSLTVSGTELRAHDARGHMALSQRFAFEVTASAASNPPELSALVGAVFALTIEDAHGHPLAVKGLVMGGERVALPDGGARYHLSLEPAIAPLAVGGDARVFQELTAIDIVKRVLERAGVDAGAVRWEVAGGCPKRPYCAQFRESDWDFIERLLAEEGVYYGFELTDDETRIVFSDDSTAAPEIEGGAEIPYRENDMVSTGDSVHHVRRGSTLRPSAVRLRDYSFEKPRLRLDAKAGDGAHEVYVFPGRFRVPSEGDRRARIRLEALRASRLVVTGGSGSARLRPGLVFEVTEHPIASVNGRYLLVSADYDASEEAGLHVVWRAIPASTPFRAAGLRHTRGPGGPQTGVVVGAAGEEIHPDSSGRVRVQFYWDREGKRDDKASTWMRVGQVPLGGSMVLPRLGWDVLVEHHEGDIDQPLVISHLYDGHHPVPYALPGQKTRTAWQTATTPGGGSANEIRFEDGAGSEELFLNASKDMNVVVGDGLQEKIGVDCTRTIGSNRDVSVGANLKVTVLENQDVSIGGSETLDVSAARSVTIGGSETATIGASRSVTVTSGMNLDAKGGRTLTVGSTMTSASAMGVSRTALGTMAVTVGGSWISAAATGVSNMTGGASSEVVGGVKLHVGAAGCETGVKGAAAETVGGAYVIAAGSNIGESSSGPLAVNVGGAFLANAPEIEIEGESEISIRCGGSSLTIKPGSVEIKAPLIAAPGAQITKKASTIKHN